MTRKLIERTDTEIQQMSVEKWLELICTALDIKEAEAAELKRLKSNNR